VLPYAGRPFPLQPYCAAGSVSSLHSLFCLGVACLEFFFPQMLCLRVLVLSETMVCREIGFNTNKLYPKR
jgi:hypothetical protein